MPKIPATKNPTTSFRNQCLLCDAIFQYPKNLRDHISSKHSIEPPKAPECHLCGKSFTKHFNLTRHMESQHGTTKIICILCCDSILEFEYDYHWDTHHFQQERPPTSPRVNFGNDPLLRVQKEDENRKQKDRSISGKCTG